MKRATIPGTAVESDDKVYRYQLGRYWALGKTLAFGCVNPSYADAVIDDMTCVKCCGFAARNGYNRILIFNALAWRSTDPKKIPHDLERAIGPDNQHWIEQTVLHSEAVVIAWGVRIPQFEDAYRRALQVVAATLKRTSAPMLCLGTTKSGDPKHPSRIGYDHQLVPWEPRRIIS